MFSVVEEVVVVERRLVLKEEIVCGVCRLLSGTAKASPCESKMR